MKRPYLALHIIILLLTVAISSRAENERTFRIINAANDLADNSAQVVTCTKTGRMIIATIGNINFYDGTSFTHADTRQSYLYNLPQYTGNYHLYFDKQHHLWLKNTNNVSCVDLLRERFIENVDSVIVSMGCSETIQDLFTDSIGGDWLLTDRGLYSTMYKKTFSVLRDRNLQDMELRDSTTLYTFYDNGEEVAQDIATGAILHRTKAYDWEKAQEYAKSSVLQYADDGFYQVRNGERKGILLHFNVRTLAWTTILELDYHINNLTMFKGMLYIPTEYGYWIYDTRDGSLSHQERLLVAGSNEPVLTVCNDLEFDRQGGMWIGTERRGVLYARPESTSFQSLTWDNPLALEYSIMLDDIEQNIYEYDGKPANCMYIDSRGWTWIGTTTGLYLLRSVNEPAELFDRHLGLFNNVVHSICEDSRHNIWLSTSCGISCLVFNGGNNPIFINSFNTLDNVPAESFTNCKARLLPDSTIIMQSVDHMIYFRPEDFDLVNIPKPFKLFPKMIRLTVNGNVVEPEKEYDGNVIIDRAFTRVFEMNLKSDQNSLVLTFSALNYFRPLQTFYHVRVVGLDDKWRTFSYFDGDGMVDSEGRLHLPLIGLLPGTYKVEVQASMLPGQLYGTPFQWTINVSQSWWNASGVYLVTGGVLLLLLIINFVIYSQNTRMRVRRSTEEGDMTRKIVAFVDRSDAFASEILAPIQEEIAGSGIDQRMTLSPEFIDIMMRLMPIVRKERKNLSMRKLSEKVGVDLAHFYEVMTLNIYKSPRDLYRLEQLKKAAELLRTTDKSVEQIASECGFYTPNYFIGNFFHVYKKTPTEFRAEG